MRLLDSRRFRNGYAAVTLFTLLAGDVWRYTITWWGFGVVAAVIFTIGILLLVRQRAEWRVAGLPLPLLAFLALATVSIVWSFYPGATAIGLTATWMTIVTAVSLAVTFSWMQLLRLLGVVLRVILAASLLFELFVSVVLRQPLLPFWVDYGSDTESLPRSLFWSRDLILDGGKIQGIVGNSALLAFIAVLSLIVFGIQIAAGRVRPVRGAFWFVVAGATVFMTRSATITVAIAVLIAVIIAVLVIRAAKTPRGRTVSYVVLAVIAATGATLALTFMTTLLTAMGKSSDLTGRSDIWADVIDLAQQRPVFGWGWVSYWVPWVKPFDDLAFEGGVRQLHAHNAWLDIWLQLGIVGLVVFGALVLLTLVRVWFVAVDRPFTTPNAPAKHTVESMLPLLLLVALICQSVVESRLLVEYGMALLVIIAVKSKRSDRSIFR